MAAAMMCCFVVFASSCKRDHKATVKQEADKMAKALIDDDFKTFVDYLPTKLLEKLGGKEKMVQAMKESDSQMEASGAKIVSYTYGDPTDVIEVGEELQCTIPLTTEVQLPTGKMTQKSTVVAISENKGETWYFIDSGGLSLDKMKEVFPNLSDELVIEDYGQPKVEPNK